ncbi:ABC transporter ATP-binding protein [Methanoregula formicica]|uniref:ABC-type branched-chain amino acid transport systems, ATPase component n=1 Tax=Methanoregula formicica (strain DSM 22288 / NBRC 105244 / SMSP) TaxID=593750 RepID=L0HHD9_METFS|nr:ABC transporter ATP-binding protein [Methanoregula formicica]AGB02728.1 ABC-type branched-chain amino acid transport systems, ATPase component [Methanoregula formicica SMSP]
MLSVSHLNVFHGNLQVVWDLSFHVNKGELVTMIGPNGAGKTTTVETIAGLNKRATGSVVFDGQEVLGRPPYELFTRGLALVPEKREIFPSMPVIENLLLGGTQNPHREGALDRVFRLFPVLRERERQEAGTLSGGEQQMLAIGRALMSEPRLLILDEPSTGLSPLLTGQVFRALEHLGREGMTVLLLEQNVRNALAMCERGYVLENGRIVEEGKSKMLLNDPRIQKAYLGI